MRCLNLVECVLIPGRKIRFDVHSKIVSFMAPDERAFPSTDAAKDDLFAALFRPAPTTM